MAALAVAVLSLILVILLLVAVCVGFPILFYLWHRTKKELAYLREFAGQIHGAFEQPFKALILLANTKKACGILYTLYTSLALDQSDFAFNF